VNKELIQRISGNIMRVLWKLKWLVLGVVVVLIVFLVFRR
jgi:hypothetical protein